MANVFGSQWQGRSKMTQSEIDIFRKIEDVLMKTGLSAQQSVITLLNALCIIIENNFDSDLADKFASYMEAFMSDVNEEKPS